MLNPDQTFLSLGYLSLGYSTPFLSLGASYMYPSLAAAKAAVISVGEEIATLGLPSGICPLIFVFSGSGNGNFSIANDSPFVHPCLYLLKNEGYPIVEVDCNVLISTLSLLDDIIINVRFFKIITLKTLIETVLVLVFICANSFLYFFS
jgi:hypothetical protein